MNYSVLVNKIVKDQYPLPLTEDYLDDLLGRIYFIAFDLTSGYYQIELQEQSIKKTAFIYKYSLFGHTSMGCGLCYAPGTFQSAMNHVLRGLTWISTQYQQLHLRRMLSSNGKHQETRMYWNLSYM